MENNSSSIESLIGRIANYGKASYKIIQLKAADKTAQLAAAAFSKAVILVLFFAFALMASIGLSLWLGELLGRTCYGFFCVSGFYGILIVIVHFIFRDAIETRIGNLVIAGLRK